jgi:hypothetical protein
MFSIPQKIIAPLLVVLVIVSMIAFHFVFAATTSTLSPTADGTDDSASWFNIGDTACNTTDCYTEVDETSGGTCTNSDGDTSYIYSDGTNVSQTFDIDESSITDGYTISAIDITVCYVKETAPGATFQTRYCFDGSCTDSGVDLTTGNSYAESTQSFSVSHTKVSGSDIEIGITDNDANKNIQVSQIKAVITYAVSDTTAPSDISDLALSGETTTTIDLDWTAPGDDAGSGTATTYDVRYSTSVINDGNWASATQATGEPTPSVAGSSESMTVSSLSSDTTYYFAIKTSDEVLNESGLSNVPSLATAASADTTAPSDISDLALSGETTTTIDLDWTAPGDDAGSGTATTYDVRYSTATITDLNWDSATQATGEPTPSVAGTVESMTISGLTEGTTYYFAIKTSDEVPNESGLSNVPNTDTLSDTTAPSDVSDLDTSIIGQTSITLTWTAPGDDASSGTATTYDVRYSTGNINAGNWNAATQATSEPTPSVAGSSESFAVGSLSAGTLYYFAIKTSDEVPNESGLSNVFSTTTSLTADTTAPSDVSDLSSSSVGQTSVNLTWTSPGDDAGSGTASGYDIRYSTSIITDLNWDSATQATSEPTPSVAGSSESFNVTSLTADTLYYFAIKTSDEVPNESGLSNIYNTTTSATADSTAPSDI